MPPLVRLHFYAANDVNGDLIEGMTDNDDFFEGLELKPRLRALGGGMLITSRELGFAAIDSGVVAPETFVRVNIPDIHPTKYIWGWWQDLREQVLVSRDERGGERFIMGGPGPLFYMHRAVLWDHTLSGSGWTFDSDNGTVIVPEDRTVGNVLQFLRDEDTARPTSFLPDLTYGFDQTEDSEGNAWGSDYQMGPDFEMAMGENYLELIWQAQEGISEPLEYTMDLGEIGSPRLRLDAWKSYGRNLTGTTFGADKVILRKGVNIESDLKAGGGRGPHGPKQSSGTALRKATHVLVQGKDGVWDQAVHPSYSPGDYTKAAKIEYPNSANPTVLERAGLRWLKHQDNGNNEFELTIKPGFDENNGLYMPGPVNTDGHVWLDDTITLDTVIDAGGSWLDYSDEPQWVTGVDLVMRDAAKSDTPDEAAKAWDVTLLLNIERGSDNSSPQGGGGTGKRCSCGIRHKLCSALTPGTETLLRFYFSSDASPLTPTVDASWDNFAGNTGRTLYEAPDGSYTGSHAITITSGGDVSGRDNGLEQAIFGPMDADQAAFFAAGGAAVAGQFRPRMRFGLGITESAQDGIGQLGVRGTVGGTNTIRDTALALHSLADSSGSTKWVAASTKVNRPLLAEAASPILDAITGCAAGDYLVVESGVRNFTISSKVTGSTAAYTSNNADDLPEDVSTTDALNTWIEFRGVSAPTGGGLHPDLVGTEHDAARCDHKHHVLSNRDPSSADDITQGYPTTTLWTNTDTMRSFLLVDEDTGDWRLYSDPNHTHTDPIIEGFVLTTDGGQHVLNTIIDTDGSQTLDLADGNVVDLTLTEDITLAFTGATSGVECRFRLIGHWATFTPTFPASVIWPNDTEPTWSTDADAVDIIEFISIDGGTTWYGDAGGSSTSGVTDHGALTGLTNDDHTQYLKETDVAAKGDIYAASANDTVGVLTVGSNDQVLTADSSQALGVKWATPSSSSGSNALLLESGHAVPFTFDDILQSSDGEDFLHPSA